MDLIQNFKILVLIIISIQLIHQIELASKSISIIQKNYMIKDLKVFSLKFSSKDNN